MLIVGLKGMYPQWKDNPGNTISLNVEHNRVYEGNPLIIPHDAFDNADLTMEYMYGEKYGTGIVLAGGNSGIGRWTLP